MTFDIPVTRCHIAVSFTSEFKAVSHQINDRVQSMTGIKESGLFRTDVHRNGRKKLKDV